MNNNLKYYYCNKIMILRTILYMIYLINIEAGPSYPTRNWLKICNTSKFSNKTVQLGNSWRDYWVENLDILY